MAMIKRMKSVLILVLVLNLLFISIPFSSVNAGAGVALSVEAPATVTEDSTFSVYFNIDTVVNLTSWSFNVVYDGDIIQIPGEVDGDSVTDGRIGSKKAPVKSWGPKGQEEGPITGDTVQIVGAVKNIITGYLDGNGFLAKATFKAKKGAPGTTSQIKMEEIVLGSKSGEQDIAIGTVTAASVTVVATDTVSPETPSGLNVLPGDQQVLLTWDANTDSDLKSYKVYRSTNGGVTWNSGTDAGKVNSYIVTGLTNGVHYTFAVTAIDTSGNESEKSATSTGTPASGSGVPISIVAPPGADENSIFDVYINIGAVENLAGWGFDFSYSSGATQIPGNQNGNGVTDGKIGTTVLPVVGWATFPGGSWTGVPVTGDTIRVGGLMGNYVSGDGSSPSYLAVVHLEAIGLPGDTSVLHVSNVQLVDNDGETIAPLTNGDVTVTITRDPTPPSIADINPENGAEGVPTNTVMTAIFSEQIIAASIEDSFTVVNGTTPISGTVSYDDAALTATFTPNALLPVNTVLTATITTDVTDLAENHMLQDYVWTFTTGNGPDYQSPSVTGINPLDGAVNVPINTHITAIFSEAMNASSINTNSFILKRGTDVIATWVYYNNATRMATLATTSYMDTQTIYTVEIQGTVKDVAGNLLSGGTYSWTFTTGDEADLVAPEVTLVNPADKAPGVGTNTSVSAGFSEIMNISSISQSTFTLVKVDGLTPVAGTVTCNGTTAVFKPSAALEENTQYKATLSKYISDIAGNYLTGNSDTQDYVWTFTTGQPDLIPPVVSGIYLISNPDGAATNTSIGALFSEAMDPFTINTASIMLTQDSTPVSGTVSYSGYTGTFNPDSDLLENTFYTITITTEVADISGNHMAEIFTLTFKVSELHYLTAPEVSSTSPAPGDTGVALNTSVTATFTQPMNSDTLNTATFSLESSSGDVAGTVVAAGANVLFMPDANLGPSTLYTATIKAGVQDLAGNAMEFDYVWSFTTGTAPDTTAPEVSSTNPVNGAEDVPIDRAITATFTEAMDALTITPLTFTLMNNTNHTFVDVEGVVRYSDTTATLYLELNDIILDPNTVYLATVVGGDSGVKDLAGNSMVENYIWSFTTGTAPDTIAPEVSSASPAPNETDVPVDRAITVTFTEPMYDITITSANITLKKASDNTPVAGNVNFYGTTAIFTPLANLAYITQYTATVNDQVTDLAGNPLAEPYSWSFTTSNVPDTLAPTVSFTDPSRNEENVAINKSISATFSEPMKEATITTATFTLMMTTGSVKVEGNVHYVGTTALFTPLADLAQGTQYTATITDIVADLAGNRMTADYAWSFTTGTEPDNTPPLVSSTYPANNETDVPLSTDVTATFNEAMDATTITSETFILVNTNTQAVVPGTVTYCITTATYALNANMEPQTFYTANVTTGVKDLAGNALAEAYSWSFKTGDAPDTEAPTVSSTVPLTNATAVYINTSVSATFSEEMDVASVNNTSFTLWKGTTSIAGSVSVAGATAVFTPAVNLDKNTKYTAKISTAVKDLSGNHLAAEYSWSFTTGTEEDNTQPQVVSVQPANGAANIPLNQSITATFNEAMNELTITNSNFTLVVTSDSTPVEAAVTYYDKTATLDPLVDLAKDTQYTATVHASVTDLAGNHLKDNANYSWSFTTGSEVDITNPTIESTDPEDKATGVKITKTITVTFDEAIKRSTVNTESFKLWKDSTQVSGNVSYNEGSFTASFTPSASLTKGTTYTAEVTNAIKDLSDNPLKIDGDLAIKSKTWTFTTEKTTPTPSGGGGGGGGAILPAVTSVSPARDATGVDVGSKVSAVFSNEMNASTITVANFTLKSSDTIVLGSVAYTSSTRTAVLTPTAPLAYATTYTAAISTNVKDTSGRALAGIYSWSFTTAQPPMVKIALSGLTSSEPLVVDSQGLLQAAAKLKTNDNKVALDIAKGTILIKAGSVPLDSMSAASAASPAAAASGYYLFMAYEFGPVGAGFNPPITLTMGYDAASLSRQGVNEKDLFIAALNGTSWEPLPSSKLDSANKAVTALLSHFSSYALIGKVTPAVTPPPASTAPAPTTSTPPPTTTVATTLPPPPTTTTAPPATTTPGTGLGGGAIAGIVIGALIVIALVVIIIRRRTRKTH
jgi:hypothetical protein